ncbi:MAG: Bcr/CflA family efflux MFS transporter [Alphaproteobacteria bacterium]|nr:Bcr/CflA family efflux MFS transporter [Alphaproteobacteria bacterium]
MPRNVRFVALLALMSGLAPISIHILLPVLPEIERAFGRGGGVSQLTLTLGLVAMAVTTIAYGPAADRFGRKPVLLFGLALFAFGSLLCIWSPNIEVLIVGRVVQAAGGAAGMVISRAIVRDVYDREESARIIGYMMSIIILAPIFAPLIGGFLTELFGWRSVFIFAGLMGAIALVFTLVGYRETTQRLPGGSFLREISTAFPILLKDRAFLAYTGYACFGVSIFMTFSGGLPHIMVNLFDRPPSDFGLFFMMIMTGFMIGTVLSTRLTPKIGIENMIRRASATGFLVALVMLTLLLTGHVSPWTIFVPAAAMGICHGLAMPNAQAAGVSVNPSIAGSASGLLIFIQMAVGAAFAQSAGMIPTDTPFPLVIQVTIAAFLAFASFSFLIGRRRS